jgi:hypothetical protein
MNEYSKSIFYKKFYTSLRLLTFVVLATVLFTSCKDKSTEEPSPIILSKAKSEFNANIDSRGTDLQLIKSTPGFAPPVAACTLGYTSLALYESLVYGIPINQSLVGQVNGLISLPKTDLTK